MDVVIHHAKVPQLEVKLLFCRLNHVQEELLGLSGMQAHIVVVNF
jgi:hypothetical protein